MFGAYVIHLETQIISVKVCCPATKVNDCNCSGLKVAIYF